MQGKPVYEHFGFAPVGEERRVSLDGLCAVSRGGEGVCLGDYKVGSVSEQERSGERGCAGPET